MTSARTLAFAVDVSWPWAPFCGMWLCGAEHSLSQGFHSRTTSSFEQFVHRAAAQSR
jgi:hypothetical protein